MKQNLKIVGIFSLAVFAGFLVSGIGLHSLILNKLGVLQELSAQKVSFWQFLPTLLSESFFFLILMIVVLSFLVLPFLKSRGTSLESSPVRSQKESDFLKSLGEMPLELSRFEAQSFVQKIVDQQKKAMESSITWHVNVEEGLEIEADRSRFEQVLHHFLENAGQAVTAKTDPWVKLEVWSEDDWLAVHISDNGVGVKPENAEKIFQPFFTTRGKDNAMGVGLSFSKYIIEQHQGEIHLSSSDQGTLFEISIPQSEAK
ncbi:MAG: HAMP domain-containing sensor histidine kinase [Pseudomonadota bacterium]